MADLFGDDPYKYVIDSSALFDLKRNYPPTVFKGVWEKFDILCDEKVVISVREVYNEIKRGSDWLVDWADKHNEIFIEPTTAGEFRLIGELQDRNPSWVDINSDKPIADPFVIACAKSKNLIIIQHELGTKNLPRIAKELGLTCYRLDKFFEEQEWVF